MLGEGELRARLDAAKEAARAGGAVLLRHYAARGALVIDQKGRNDFVSQADRESEAVIFAALGAAFPGDTLLGEETGFAGGRSALVWCIDPLDGTSNFLKGAHNWCVSIGLLEDGVPVLGVVYDPVRGEMFEGARDLGARCNDSPIKVSAVSAPDHAAVGVGHTARIPVATFTAETGLLLDQGFAFRQVGAGALMLAYLAAGRIDAYYERHMWPWDAVAGLALLTVAGGTFAPYQAAKPEAGGRVLASNGLLQGAIEAILPGKE